MQIWQESQGRYGRKIWLSEDESRRWKGNIGERLREGKDGNWLGIEFGG